MQNPTDISLDLPKANRLVDLVVSPLYQPFYMCLCLQKVITFFFLGPLATEFVVAVVPPEAEGDQVSWSWSILNVCGVPRVCSSWGLEWILVVLSGFSLLYLTGGIHLVGPTTIVRVWVWGCVCVCVCGCFPTGTLFRGVWFQQKPNP